MRRFAPWSALAVAVAAIAYGRFFRPVEVSTHTIAAGEIVVETFARGTLEARREAQLGFDLPGRLAAVLVDAGDRVTVGQELARLEADQYGAEIRTAASTLGASRASLGRLQAEERSARAALELAEREETRARSLLAAQAVTSSEADAAESRTQIARAALDRVLAQQVEAMRAVEVASRGVEQRRTTFVRATLLAPFDGVITRRSHEPGDTVGIGSTVVRIADPSDVLVNASVDETALPELREGQRARVTLIADSIEREGVVERIGAEVDRQTHEVVVEIRVEAPARASLGQRADVRIESGRKSAPAVLPLAFLRHDDRGTFAWTASGGRIRRAGITVGVEGAELVEVLDGIAPGDVVLAPRDRGDLPVGRRWREP